MKIIDLMEFVLGHNGGGDKPSDEWPKFVSKLTSAMQAIGWKSSHRDQDKILFHIKGQEADDQMYMVIVDNLHNGTFMYAFGTVEGGQPDIGQHDIMHISENNVFELLKLVGEGFGMNEGLRE